MQRENELRGSPGLRWRDRHNAKDFSGSHIKPFEVFVARLSSYGYLNIKKLPTLP